MSKKVLRRTFNTAGAAAAVGWVASTTTAASADKVTGANNRIRLGFIGVANRGGQLIDAKGPTRPTTKQQLVQFQPLSRIGKNEDVVYQLRVRGAAAGGNRVRVQVQSNEAPNAVTKEESTLVYKDE